MSIFGLISLFVALVSVSVIVVHSRIMRKRAPVDIHFATLEELLRVRIELLYNASPQDSELNEICATCVDLDYDTIVSVLPSIKANMEDEPPTEDMEANTTDINSTIEALNTAIETYNEAITKKSSAALMAMALGLETLETVELHI